MNIEDTVKRLEVYGEVKVRYIPKTARWEASVVAKRFKVTGYPESTIEEALQRLYNIVNKANIELNTLRGS